MRETDEQSIGQLLLYQTDDGHARIQVRLQDETLWLTGSAMAELFQISRPTITSHLNRIFSEQELLSERVIRYYLTTAADGKRYRTGFYNLDAVLAVGYRVRSHRGTHPNPSSRRAAEGSLARGQPSVLRVSEPSCVAKVTST